MDDNTKSGLIKAATSEYTLLIYRITTVVVPSLILTFVLGTREDVRTVAKDLSDFKVAYEGRIAKVEGQVDGLKGSVEVHRQRLSNDDNDLRALWARLYELARAGPNSVPPAIP